MTVRGIVRLASVTPEQAGGFEAIRAEKGGAMGYCDPRDSGAKETRPAGLSPADAFRDAMLDQPILVTGAAGFVGFHVCRQLLAEGRNVVGLDNLNDYYDPALKQSRLDILLPDRL